MKTCGDVFGMYLYSDVLPYFRDSAGAVTVGPGILDRRPMQTTQHILLNHMLELDHASLVTA